MADLKQRLAQLRSQQAQSSSSNYSSSSSPNHPQPRQSTPSSSSNNTSFVDPLALQSSKSISKAQSDSDSILESRLKALNPSSSITLSPSSSSRSISSNQTFLNDNQNLHSLLGSNFLSQDFKNINDDNDRDEESEIKDLLESTHKAVEIERNQYPTLGEDFSPGEMIFGKVQDFGSDDYDESDSEASDIEDGVSSPKLSNKNKGKSGSNSFNYEEESGKWRRESDDLIKKSKERESISNPSTLKTDLHLHRSNQSELKSFDLKDHEIKSNLLVIEPKEKPTLSRSSSLVDLEDELANAMSEDFENNSNFKSDLNFKNLPSRSSSTQTQSQIKIATTSSSSSGTLDSDLSSRFSRPQTDSKLKNPNKGKGKEIDEKKILKENDHDDNTFFNLPSVPTSIPSYSSSPDSTSSTKVSTSNLHINEEFDQNDDNDDDDDEKRNPFNSLPSAPTSDPILNKSNHEDLNEVDLTSFSKLVRLNAKNLSDPNSSSTNSSRISQSKSQVNKENGEEEDEEDPENWCCICSEDASIKCKGCDLDPYCSSCWTEGHSNMLRDEIREHGTIEFHGKNRRKNDNKGGKGKKGGGDGGRKLMAA